MSFESVPGVKIFDRDNDRVYIVGDFFSINSSNENDLPQIFTWREVLSVKETLLSFIVEIDGEPDTVILKSVINDTKKLLALRTIFESVVSVNPGINYTHLKRILPTKTNYKNNDIPANAIKANGIYDDKEISYSNIVLVTMRVLHITLALGAVFIVLTFAALVVFVGEVNVNWRYFIPISVFSGAIISMFIYLICTIVARMEYATFLKNDPAITEDITFVLAETGFAAVETDLYTGCDLISWDDITYYLETNYTYILFCGKRAVCWIPRRIFDKGKQQEVSDFIVRHLLKKPPDEKAAKAGKAAKPAKVAKTVKAENIADKENNN
ncbi:hypothetical protein FACS189499_02710 [Clostridia bacterium]|nr:hypothetical protein FACS189499_02710 [Clostridia bacterium]